MKGVPRSAVQDEIRQLLEQVQLDHVADHRVGTFSGGMKRRLSVAIAFVGNPEIVFLDEPTTGMDPKIRRNIWNLILEEKLNRVMIMTTHSMEEADILGDTIAIMANGRLKVLGTSINLKNRFSGFVVELLVTREGVREIMDLVAGQLTGKNH
jgi:ABC-type multidrug transport system ATPase subunit